MASKFVVDFKQGLILEEDVNFGFEFNSRCHKYSVKKEHHKSPTSIKLVPKKVLKKPWLYGPATCLESKSIIYPCETFACAIPCPCLICSKTHPSCRVPSADGCSCPDCYKHFADHNDFHCTYHYGCKFCCQLVKTIPCFNFAFLDKEEKTRKHPQFSWWSPRYQFTIDFSNKWKYGGQDGKPMGLGECWCKPCKLVVWSLDLLREHIQKTHSVSKVFNHQRKTTYNKNPGEEYKCDQCDLCFKLRKSLQRHVNKVHLEETYDCKTCGETFTRKGNLMRHLITKRECKIDEPESDELDTAVREAKHLENTVCDVCYSSFTNKYNLERHKKSHRNGDVQHVCEVCSQAFKRKDLLSRHMLMHSSDPNFKCETCGKQFNRESSLTRHKGVHEPHTREVQFCDLCNTHFGLKSNLLRHFKGIKNDAGDARHVCEHCKKQLCTSRLLRTHVIRAHSPWSKQT